MKCDVCDLRDAVIHVRQMQKSGLQELHLCEECARERGYLREDETELSVSPLLTGLLGGARPAEPPQARAACPRCGLTAAEFRKRGRAGCADCYGTFEADLRTMIAQMAARPRHAGKLPRDGGEAAERPLDRQALAAELKEAVEREEYERAAELRDRIRSFDAGT
jgi:protein arginine kinase activator